MGTRAYPDVLLIVLDTLRADRLSCYDYARPTSPHLDAFAEGGVLFERGVSPAQWTIPAHASLFTGEYPTTHGTTQIYDRHSPAWPTLAEYLQKMGYATLGFCNNPLLGVVDNHLDRGFEAFYNYGGVLPQRPHLASSRRNGDDKGAWHQIMQWVNRLNAPLQDWLTHNDGLLGMMLHPWITPLWERHINFKGNVHQSVSDLVAVLRRHREQDDRPVFAFLNVMETHLPYEPPTRFVRRFAPYYRRDAEARTFMESYNHRTYDWIAPITEPFTELEHRVLNDLYDVEVAYQDSELRLLFDYLDTPEVRDDTLVIVTGDHGEGLDHHNYVGHSLVVYEDLLHVPLIFRYPPRFPAGERRSAPVSTRRVFHTILEAVGFSDNVASAGEAALAEAVGALSLSQGLDDQTGQQDVPFAEAYSPVTLVNLMAQRNPEAVEQFRCRSSRRAVYEGLHKLLTVDEEAEELFDLQADPAELHNHLDEWSERADALQAKMAACLAKARERRHEDDDTDAHVDLGKDEQLTQRLRALGYLE